MAEGRNKESTIEKQILSWLNWKGIMAWKIKSMGTWDPNRGQWRRPSRFYRIGVSDILGIYKGKPLAIEVKSLKGKPTDAQELFLDEFRQNGGIAFIAKSIEDVEFQLKLEDQASLERKCKCL